MAEVSFRGVVVKSVGIASARRNDRLRLRRSGADGLSDHAGPIASSRLVSSRLVSSRVGGGRGWGGMGFAVVRLERAVGCLWENNNFQQHSQGTAPTSK